MDTAHAGSTLDYVAAAILELDADGRVKSANAAAQRLFRRAEQSQWPVGLDFVELWVPAADALTAIRQALTGARSAFRGIVGELDGVPAEDNPGDWRVTLQPVIQADGTVTGVVATGVPLGETAAAARYERSIADTFLDCSRTGVTILSRELDILRVNPIMEEWYAHATPLEGRKCYAVFHGREERCENCGYNDRLFHTMMAKPITIYQ